MARIEIVQTDAEQPFHVRFVAGNGRTAASSETYTERRGALVGIAVVAEAFGISMNRPPDVNDDTEVGEIGVYGETPEGVVHLYPVVDVDERETTEDAT